jgi:hypothetical protein
MSRGNLYKSTIKKKGVKCQYTATIEIRGPYLAYYTLQRSLGTTAGSLGGPFLGAQAKKFLDDQCFSSPFPIYYMVFPAMYSLFQSN